MENQARKDLFPFPTLLVYTLAIDLAVAKGR